MGPFRTHSQAAELLQSYKASDPLYSSFFLQAECFKVVVAQPPTEKSRIFKIMRRNFYSARLRGLSLHHSFHTPII